MSSSKGRKAGWRSDKRKTAERGYGGRWQKARKAFLSRPENVLCRMCCEDGQVTAATVVDHIIPHEGDQALFWDETNWQPLCATHHSGAKQAEEGSGMARGCAPDGTPRWRVESEREPERAGEGWVKSRGGEAK